MRPEAAALLLVSAMLLALIIPPADAAGPPEHANTSSRAVEAVKEALNRGPADAPGQNKDPDAEEERTESAAPLPGIWAAVLVLVLLAGGSAILLRHLKKREPDACRTVVSRPPGFPPELADRYDRATFIGRGGLGEVFSARRRDDGQVVAVKVPLARDEVTGRAFMNEMRFLEDLNHPNILAVHSVNILPVPFVEMEYLPRTLKDLDKPLPPETAARIAAGIAAGLAFAHERGVVHLDIKPGNILIADDLTPKIADWGMGRMVETGSDTGVTGYTLAYAAPEQIAPGRYGRPDARTDIYQTGAVFYELVTGRPPFADGNLAGLAEAILNDQPLPPPAFDRIILRCLEKDPANRYQSATELLDAILAAMEGAGET
ncbi:MAG TPA: serine/threonine-protein kinase [Methanoculleus sp.]|nr:serine/threonine-protein kinase [Methanoculleus sp.]